MSDSNADGVSLRSSFYRYVQKDWYFVALLTLVGAACAVCYALVQAPVYSSSATLYVTSASDDNSQAAYQGSLASQQRVSSYAELVVSNSILENASTAAGFTGSVEEARDAVKATTQPGTVLLTIEARSRDSAEASRLANAVADSMVAYVENLEKPAGGGSAVAKLTVVSRATASTSPVAPNIGIYIALGGVLGLVVGVVAMMLRRRYDDKVRTSEDIDAITGSIELGVVPFDSSLAGSGLLDFSKSASLANERYRKIRTNLGFVGVDSSTRCFLITSCTAGEGKTTSSVNLAVALAESGSRVLLVDADLRRPRVAEVLELNGSVGLTSVLTGSVDVVSVIQASRVPNLDVLTAGPTPPNPAELLGSGRAADLFVSLAEEYDYVIVDCAPVLPVADAAIVAQYVAGVILVVREGSLRRSALSKGVSDIATTRTPIIGYVLNCASGSEQTYGSSYYYRDSDADSAITTASKLV